MEDKLNNTKDGGVKEVECCGLLAQLESAHTHVCNLAAGDKKWEMKVPPQKDDSDVILCDALILAKAEIIRLRRGLEDVERRVSGKSGNPKWILGHLENLMEGRSHDDWG